MSGGAPSGLGAPPADHLVGTYRPAPFELVAGEGAWLVDRDGRRYLDFVGGIAVAVLGHADPEVVAAIREQVGVLGHVSNLYRTAPPAALAAALCGASFADRVFFSNSGAEANEAALKFARRWARATGADDKVEAVAFAGGFHGRTLGALSLTAKEEYRAPFEPLVPGIRLAPFNDPAAAEEAIGERTCAVFVEPVQGEGGVRVAEASFLAALRELCDRHRALLVLDEVQCGLGRTGRLWAHEHCGVTPDMMTLAKGLGGGLPLGATLVTERVAAAVRPGDHGSTFGGNPVACRAAAVVLARVAEPAFLARVGEVAAHLRRRLAELDLPAVREVRGLGLMVGVQLDREAAPLVEAGWREGVLMTTAGPDVLRLLPPLVITTADVDRLLAVLARLLGARTSSS
jgi:predicted acetylornithine/succinylornithine family transaminase